jgi:hypothetical protein
MFLVFPEIRLNLTANTCFVLRVKSWYWICFEVFFVYRGVERIFCLLASIHFFIACSSEVWTVKFTSLITFFKRV